MNIQEAKEQLQFDHRFFADYYCKAYQQYIKYVFVWFEDYEATKSEYATGFHIDHFLNFPNEDRSFTVMAELEDGTVKDINTIIEENNVTIVRAKAFGKSFTFPLAPVD